MIWEGEENYCTRMNLETNRLIKLVNDLLVLTRSDAGALSLEIQSFDLDELVQTRCDLMEPLTIQKAIQSYHRNSPLIFVLLVIGDPNRTAQVLDNLLNNALRYAPRDSEYHDLPG